MTSTLTTFGNNSRAIACRIFIPPSSENMIFVHGRMAIALTELIRKWFCNALEEKGILTLAPEQMPREVIDDPVFGRWHRNELCMIFCVSNWRVGFTVIKERLTALKLLDYASISYRDTGEGIWRPLYPTDQPAFNPSELIRRWLENLPPV
jgi:hypothetical protein